MENKRRFMINMIANIISFVVSLGISFFVAPFIIKNIGMEANGFVSLANNFINYVSVLIVALNSMAGRFITIAIHKGDEEEANKYFTSIVFANIIIALTLLVPSVFLIFFLEKIINIPAYLVWDVKLLFSLVFLTYFISIIGTSFSVSTFATNRLDLSAKRNIESNILRAIVIYLLFRFLPPHVSYIGIISLILTLYVCSANVYYTKKLLPNIKIKKIYFESKKIFEVVKSGIWNSISRFAQILTDGLDLLITNLFVNPLAMGQLATAKLLPTIVLNLTGTISSIFQPNMTKYYAQGDKDNFMKELRFAMKVSGFFANIPLSFIAVFGFAFFTLWIPGQNNELIYILLILTLVGISISGVLDPIWGVFTITNKIKINSLVAVATGVVNISLVFILLRFTNLGVFVIPLVSSATSFLRCIIFVPIYAAHCIGVKRNSLYSIIFRYISVTFVMLAVFYVIYTIINPATWLVMFITCGMCGVIGLIVNFLLLFDRHEKDFFTKDIINKIKSLKK